MIHAAITAAADALTRREPHRQAHLEHLVGLRKTGRVIGGGPSPDGRTADLFYRIQRPADLASLIDEDPYTRAGVWTGHAARAFSQFVEPWELPPVVVDGSRRAMVIEGPVTDTDMAQLALVELRGTGHLVFGGCFEDGGTTALVRSADPAEAVARFAATGFWVADRLIARPLVYLL